MNRTVLWASALALVFAAAPAHAAGTTSPGKNSVHASADAVAINSASLVTAQILKGKKKTVLEMDVTATCASGPSLGGVGAIGVTVNGIGGLIQPTPGVWQQFACDPSFNCAGHGLFWLDMDAAEAANPGMFVGQPLNIVMNGASASTMGNCDVSLRARVAKK